MLDLKQIWSENCQGLKWCCLENTNVKQKYDDYSTLTTHFMYGKS